MIFSQTDSRTTSKEISSCLGRGWTGDKRCRYHESFQKTNSHRGHANILLITLVAIFIVILGLFWIRLDSKKEYIIEQKPGYTLLGKYANEYAGSVAFVVVDYRLERNDRIVYRNKGEGTAFLVDHDGYLLTNRHVACPWLVDDEFDEVIQRHRMWELLDSLRFSYRMYLWFEGEKAFNRAPDLEDSSELTDIYRTDSAFKTDGSPRVCIAGVAWSPAGQRGIATNLPLNDIAVLKIDNIPQSLKPLPLDKKMKVKNIPRLSPVISMGFPLGSITLGTHAYVSVTRGHVRRAFDGILQIDASFYSGNSGGPVIDIYGNVIGIASRVAVAPLKRQPMFLNNRLSDFGQVLAIYRAVEFLNEIKSGKIKWNGYFDPAIKNKLNRIKKIACDNRWADALALADKELKLNYDPYLIMTSGIMHFCVGDIKGAQSLFNQNLSINPDDTSAKLMLFLIDWLDDRAHVNHYRRDLLALDWRSSGELGGYLTRILEMKVDEASALNGWYTDTEKSWINYIVSLILAKREDLEKAEHLLKEAVLAADKDFWIFSLARARLDQIQSQRLESYFGKTQFTTYQKEVAAFCKTIQKVHAEKKNRRNKQLMLWKQFEQALASSNEKRQNLEKIIQIDNRDVNARLMLINYYAMDDMWPQALEHTRIFLKKKGREDANWLGVGLMEPMILHKMGHTNDALSCLEKYYSRTQNPWFHAISGCLLGKRSELSLLETSRIGPENLMTAHMALGLWAEGNNNRIKAIKHYKEAMASCLDNWLEYDFAKKRIKKLRSQPENLNKKKPK